MAWPTLTADALKSGVVRAFGRWLKAELAADGAV
jgi:hypothetical protein